MTKVTDYIEVKGDKYNIDYLRSKVEECSTITQAYDQLEDFLGISRRQVRRLNHKHNLCVGFKTKNEEVVSIENKSDLSKTISIDSAQKKFLEKILKDHNIDPNTNTVRSFRIEKNTKGLNYAVSVIPKQIDNSSLINDFLERAKKHSPKTFNYSRTKFDDNEKLLEISIVDLHLSRLVWAKECGEDYDLKIAAQLFKDSMYNLAEYARKHKVERIVIPVGNDFYDSDNMAGTTTKGTNMAPNEDSRWQKTFSTGCDIVSEVIEQLGSEFKVDILVIPGNHDQERTYYLGKYLEAWFRNHKNVTINNDPTERKYYTFGKNLIVYTHGSDVKIDKLPLVIAAEEPEKWGNSKFREIHTAHLHHEVVKELNGVKCRTVPSLVVGDVFTVKNGWVGNRRCSQAFLFDAEKGLENIYYYYAN